MMATEPHIDPKQQTKVDFKAESPEKTDTVPTDQDASAKETTKSKKETTNKAKDKPSTAKSIITLISDFFLSLLNGTFLTKDNMLKSVYYFFFLTFIAITYIANTYYAEKMVRITDRTKRDLKELRYEHITTKSQLMSLSKQSEIVKRLLSTGLKESVVPPEKIFIKVDPANAEKSKTFWLPNTLGE